MSKAVAEILAWSLEHSYSGKAPLVGFYGEAFPKNTWRHQMAGQTMASGFRPGVVGKPCFTFFVWENVVGGEGLSKSPWKGNILLLEVGLEGPL